MFLDSILGINIFDPNTYKKKEPQRDTTTKIETTTNNIPTYTVDQFRPSINLAPVNDSIYNNVTFLGKVPDVNNNSITITNPNNTNTNQNNNSLPYTPVTNIPNDLLNSSSDISKID